MDKKEDYNNWVQRVCSFLAEKGPVLNKPCVSFQSKPILDGPVDVVLLGYNPHENGEYYLDSDRFYNGNPSFCDQESRKRREWKIWNRLYDAFWWAEYTKALEDGSFVFFNAVYFGSNKIQELKAVPGSAVAIDKCLDFTGEVIQDIFKPKCVMCLSIPDCFDRLNHKYHFDALRVIKLSESIRPDLKDFAIKKSWKTGVPNSNRCIKAALWKGIPVYGIPHPSGYVSDLDWGLIALYLRGEMEKIGIGKP